MFVYYMFLFWIAGEFDYVLGDLNTGDPQIKEWKCANRDCSAPISQAEVVFNYVNPDHKLKLPLPIKKKVDVLRKPSKNEKEQNFWWISIDGKEGYAFKKYLKETDMLSTNFITVKKEILNPTPTKKVVDGTTVFETDFIDNVGESPNNSNSHQSKFNGGVEEEEDDDDVKVENEEKEETSPGFTSSNTNPMPNDSVQKSNTENGILPSISDGNPENSDASIASQLDNTTNNLEQNFLGNKRNETTNESLDLKKTNPETKESDEIKESKTSVNLEKSTNKKSVPSVLMNFENSKQTPINYENMPGQPVKEEIQAQSNLLVEKVLPEIGSNEKTNSLTTNASSIENNEASSVPPTIENSANVRNVASEKEKPDATDTNKLKQQNYKNQNLSNTSSSAVIEEIVERRVENSTNTTIKQGDEKSSAQIAEPTVLNTTQSVSEFPQNSNVASEKEKPDAIDTNKLMQQNYKNQYLINSYFTSSATIKQKSVERSVEFLKGSANENIETNVKSNDEQIEPTYPGQVESDFEQTSSNMLLDREQIKNDSVFNPGQTNIDISLDPRQEKSNSLDDPGQTDIDNLSDPKLLQNDTLSNSGQFEKDNLPEESDTSNNKLVENENLLDEVINSDNLVNEKLVDKTVDSYVDEVINLDDQISEDSSMKWFSSVYSFMGSLKELYKSTFGNDKSTESEYFQSSESINNADPVECDNQNLESSNGQHCQSSESIIFPVNKENVLPEINVHMKMGTGEDSGTWFSFKSMMGIGFSAVVVLVFSLGYYYIDNLRRDGELVQKNNTLASELFVLEREKSILEEDFTQLKEDLERIIKEKDTLKEELNKIKEEKSIVEESESKLKKKLVMVDQNYNELRKIFSETKQKGERATLISDIKKLKESIAADIIEIASLKEELLEKKNEIKTLTTSLQKSQDAKNTLEEIVDKLVTEGKVIAKDYQETLSKMEQTIEENKLVQSQLEEDVRKLKKEYESLIIQKELAESALQKAHGITPKESLAEWTEIKDVRASLITAEKGIDKLTKERNELSVSLKSVEEKVKLLTTELKKYENSEKEKLEALTKLQVLSNYFKEKETQLQEELGMKEAQWLQKQSEDSTVYQQMNDLREENTNLKALIETLKKEILDQEARFKKIEKTNEQKATENWVSLRRTEVRLKEVQAEAAQLRNRLTTLETCDNPEDKLNKTTSGGLEVNGDLPQIGSAMSPPFMLYSSEFIPPPPLIQVPQSSSGNPSSRPPPLGRISSPPLVSGDFIPPPPIVPYEMFPHIHANPPSPPLPQPVLHKPQPRDHHHMAIPSQVPPARKQKDSQSSNQSSESPLDNKTPARRSKR